MTSYIYTFVREDISPEQKIVQLGHACHEAGKLLPASEFKEPSTMILLSARDEYDLELISHRIDRAGIDHYMFWEPDPMYNGKRMGYSAICTRPVFTDRERAFFGRWDLYRHTY
jgi:hypothetical protein